MASRITYAGSKLFFSLFLLTVLIIYFASPTSIQIINNKINHFFNPAIKKVEDVNELYTKLNLRSFFSSHGPILKSDCKLRYFNDFYTSEQIKTTSNKKKLYIETDSWYVTVEIIGTNVINIIDDAKHATYFSSSVYTIAWDKDKSEWYVDNDEHVDCVD